MLPALDSLANGFPYLIFYLLVVSAIYVIGLVIYTKLTPHKELQLVQDGNMAAAIHFSSLIISLALPLSACLINRFSFARHVVDSCDEVALKIGRNKVINARYEVFEENDLALLLR